MKVLATKTIAIMTRSLAVFAILAGFYLSSNSIISNAYAANDTESVQASVTVPDACYISGTNYNHTGSVSGGSYNTDFGGISTVTVRCNDRNGYSVYAVGYSGDTAGSTDLIGASTNLTIPTGTGTSTATSHWAMKIGTATSSFTPTILNGYNNYNVVPSTATKVVTYTSDIDLSGDSKFTTSYAVAVAPSQAADTYTGKVKYTIVHPNYSNADGSRETYNVPVTFAGKGISSVTFTATGYPTRTVSTSGGTANLAAGVTYTATASFTSGYELASWALNNANYGTLGSTSTNPTTFTPNANSASAIVTLTSVFNGTYIQDLTLANCPTDGMTVYDKRDGKTYTVKKIQDACWMTQNLRYLGDTNSAAKTMTIGNRNSNVANNKSITLYSLNSSNAGNFNAYNSSKCGDGSTAGYNNACVYDSGSTSTGVWYNYYAATAGTISGSSNSTAASQDICPKNWHLPRYNTSSPAGSINSITSQSTAFSPVTGGRYGSGSLVEAAVGNWWSATANDANFRLNLSYSGSSLSLSLSLRYIGFYVRCTRTS